MLKQIKLTLSLCVLFCFLSTFVLNAQDVHFSQYYTSPTLVNPASTGVFNEDYRLAIQYRRQWQSVPVDYKTILASFDGKIEKLSSPNGYFSGGIVGFYDLGGDGHLSYTNIQPSCSYTRQLNDHNFLTLGTSLALGQRRVNYNGLDFGEEFNGDVFVNSTNLSESLDNKTKVFMDFGTGINWHIQDPQNKYFGLDVGMAIFHLNRPSINFADNETVALPFRYTISLVGNIKTKSRIGFLLHNVYQKQQNFRENISGLITTFQIADRVGQRVNIGLGTNYRIAGESDAIIPNLLLVYNQFVFNLSYDINISSFSAATQNKGGVELGFQYRITKVEQLSVGRPCPLF